MNKKGDLENKFHEEMLEVYRKTKTECKYNATRFLQIVNKHGGLRAAKMLINASSVSDGFTELWKHRRLDLTVEARVLDPQWSELFSDDEKKIAKKRLDDLDYNLD
jgi:hypothetical protein